MFWSEIGSGLEEPGGTPLPRIPKSTPRGVKKDFIKREALRLLRMYSSQTTFEKNIQKFRKSPEERGYPAAIVTKYLSEVKSIHMDIQCNPGPERLENSQINHLQPSDNSSRNLNNRASNVIKYSRSELLQLQLRQFKIPDETFHLLKSNGIFRTRGVRSGQAVRNHKHNITISHVQRKPDNTKPGERGVNLHNLC